MGRGGWVCATVEGDRVGSREGRRRGLGEATETPSGVEGCGPTRTSGGTGSVTMSFVSGAAHRTVGLAQVSKSTEWVTEGQSVAVR